LEGKNPWGPEYSYQGNRLSGEGEVEGRRGLRGLGKASENGDIKKTGVLKSILWK